MTSRAPASAVAATHVATGPRAAYVYPSPVISMQYVCGPVSTIRSGRNPRIALLSHARVTPANEPVREYRAPSRP